MARRSTNAFGEAWQGSKIQGAGALARARGYAYGSLSSQQRGAYGSQRAFQKAAEDSESEEAREARLKKQGREEVLNRQPEYVKPVTKSETASAPRPPQKAAQNKPQSPSMGEKWSDGVDIPGMGRMPLDRVPSPMKPASPTPSADALRKLRRKINRNEQRPSYFSSGQVNRGDW